MQPELGPKGELVFRPDSIQERSLLSSLDARPNQKVVLRTTDLIQRVDRFRERAFGFVAKHQVKFIENMTAIRAKREKAEHELTYYKDM